MDSIPVMAQAGELIAPRSSFEEVIGSVRAQREAEKIGAPMGKQQPGYAEVVLTMKGGLMDWIEAKIVERKQLGISLQGA